MSRCMDLALSASGRVAPNPMVGAVLVYNDHIIGEGCHEHFGQAHAEVNCLNSVKPEDRHLISQSTLYVSLEPCSHFGKTPPCTELIINHNIPEVIIGRRDPFKLVNGSGIQQLQENGISIKVNVLREACENLNKRFFTFHKKQRPYVILKWAQTADLKIAAGNEERLFISNECTNRLVHRWRMEESSILVGTNTAIADNPALNNRFWTGKNPLKMILDLSLRLPSSLHIFDAPEPVIIFNGIKQEQQDHQLYYKINDTDHLIPAIMEACFLLHIQSIIVEGGTKLLQSFIDFNCWDECRVITNHSLFLNDGIAAPIFSHKHFIREETYSTDRIQYFVND